MANLDRSLVANLPLFAGLAPEELDELLQEAQSARYPKGTNVFDQDGEAHSFFMLLHGHLRVVKLTPEGQQVVVRFVVPGEIFGIAVALGGTAYPATATAIVDSVVLLWPSSAWMRLVVRFPMLGANTLQTVGSRLRDAHTRVVEISTERVERRVAHVLLRLANQSGRKVEEGVQINFPISGQDIAQMTGTTIETVSRVLSIWEDRGWVERGRQRIIIREPHRLFDLAKGSAG